jgi:hypothetical protein
VGYFDRSPDIEIELIFYIDISLKNKQQRSRDASIPKGHPDFPLIAHLWSQKIESPQRAIVRIDATFVIGALRGFRKWKQ